MTADVETIRKTSDEVVITPPQKWRVVFFNDDSTPMDFVIELLCTKFNHTVETAKEITLIIHESGRAIAGTYSYEIAEQKASEAISESRNRGYPLNVELEKD